MRAILTGVMVATLAGAAWPCGNDSEHQMVPPPPDPVEDVVSGRVYAHAREWDEARVKELPGKLGPLRTVERYQRYYSTVWDDLALSLIRLGRAEEALAVLDDKDA